MSAERSSSAVRNLRSIFENRESEAHTQNQRSRSGSAEPSRERRRPLSKVRSSFVAVDSGKQMEDSSHVSDTIAEVDGGGALERRESTAALRRQSFSANTIDSEELGLKKVITDESEKRGRDKSIQETIPENAMESTPIGTPDPEAATGLTPIKATKDTSKSGTQSIEDPQPPVHPDKPVTGAEEEAGSLRPADPKSETLISGGAAHTKATIASDDLSTPKSDTPTATAQETQPILAASPVMKKVPLKQISTNKPAPSTDEKPTTTTPASTTLTAKPANKSINRKVSRSSLATSTAASSARAASHEQTALPSRPKPRETTKPLEMSAHLLAPTAASRARHESEGPAANTKDAHKNVRTSTAANSTRAPPRTSMARQSRPGSQNAHIPTRKPPAPVASESFLERMTRPTAASQSRAQEKYEARSPPRKAVPAPKRTVPSRTNGTTHTKVAHEDIDESASATTQKLETSDKAEEAGNNNTGHVSEEQ